MVFVAPDLQPGVAGATRPCPCCKGEGGVSTAYDRQGVFFVSCPRCNGALVDPGPRIHSSLLLRNVRSGKAWAVYGDYPPDEWGLHRMKPARCRRYYVWQIIIRPEHELLDGRRWTVAGYGDAWEHDKMESDPLGAPS